MISQGDILYLDLDPAKGNETKKIRPCVVVSNDQYNQIFNTVIVVPISSSDKYKQRKYLTSPFFIDVRTKNNVVDGTILLQHLRSVDPVARTTSQSPVDQLENSVIQEISTNLAQYF
ncbi:type II toxin-antitoxin system PemK/MazF family toxin [Paucilactobacillus kaifaensis]|uniref:type II toxin-antitoxin system PemK/MazF family toxin n=1 Tax=Paucilactobacillus kaifaensis TaxID=2559921 RepID=UPI0010F761CC|nr:type II toxin-antitoxin system PemK/MazF family toxin [Paucilactobacillus kaifaensis]